MRVILLAMLLLGGYMYFLVHTTDTVMHQVTQFNSTYQYVADHADQIATGR